MKNLTASRQIRQPRGDGYRVAEHIGALLQHGAEVKSHVDRDRRPVGSSLSGDSSLHVGCCAGGAICAREDRHHFIADGLDHTAAAVDTHLLDERKAALDGGERLGVAEILIELRAAADVGEQHGKVAEGSAMVRD